MFFGHVVQNDFIEAAIFSLQKLKKGQERLNCSLIEICYFETVIWGQSKCQETLKQCRKRCLRQNFNSFATKEHLNQFLKSHIFLSTDKYRQKVKNDKLVSG